MSWRVGGGERSSADVRIRLRRDVPVVGSGLHRSGWPFALRALEPLDAPDGILLEDFVERHFLYPRHHGQTGRPIREPWIGIFHHGYGIPHGLGEQDRVQEVLRCPEFAASQPHLVLAVALSRHLARFLRKFLQVPVVALRHPTETPARTFSPEAFLRNPERSLVQLGWYLRNTRLVHQIPPRPELRRVRLAPGVGWARYYDRRVVEYWERRKDRREWPGVVELPRLSDAAYDRLLACNVAATELFDASANNVVVECLVRNTPLLVNRHPAVEEYLGPEYPLLFDRFDQVDGLLETDRILEAHEYWTRLDKSVLSGSFFRRSLQDAAASALREGGRE